MPKPIDLDAIRTENEVAKTVKIPVREAACGPFLNAIGRIDQLLAEVERLMTNPDCPGCGHSIATEHYASFNKMTDETSVACGYWNGKRGCGCVNWRIE